MKAVKNLTIVGLCFYGLGLLSNTVNSFLDVYSLVPNDVELQNHTKYFLNSILLTSLSVLIQLLIGGLIALSVARFFKKSERKRAVFMASVSGGLMLWHIAFTALAFTPAVPQYLLYGKLGLIDTYFAYILPILKNGAPLMFIGALLIFIGAMLEIFKKRKNDNEVQ